MDKNCTLFVCCCSGYRITKIVIESKMEIVNMLLQKDRYRDTSVQFLVNTVSGRQINGCLFFPLVVSRDT